MHLAVRKLGCYTYAIRRHLIAIFTDILVGIMNRMLSTIELPNREFASWNLRGRIPAPFHPPETGKKEVTDKLRKKSILVYQEASERLWEKWKGEVDGNTATPWGATFTLG